MVSASHERLQSCYYFFLVINSYVDSSTIACMCHDGVHPTNIDFLTLAKFEYYNSPPQIRHSTASSRPVSDRLSNYRSRSQHDAASLRGPYSGVCITRQGKDGNLHHLVAFYNILNVVGHRIVCVSSSVCIFPFLVSYSWDTGGLGEFSPRCGRGQHIDITGNCRKHHSSYTFPLVSCLTGSPRINGERWAGGDYHPVTPILQVFYLIPGTPGITAAFSIRLFELVMRDHGRGADCDHDLEPTVCLLHPYCRYRRTSRSPSRCNNIDGPAMITPVRTGFPLPTFSPPAWPRWWLHDGPIRVSIETARGRLAGWSTGTRSDARVLLLLLPFPCLRSHSRCSGTAICPYAKSKEIKFQIWRVR